MAAAVASDINQLLHDARSARLRLMPRVSGTLLSAGCSGTWYFKWIESRTAHYGRHIGLEFYSPKPDALPRNVEWIANTVGDMGQVKDGECALVLSGENLEHLWPEDVVGFFVESWRVLSPGGWLIVDSPNRLLTQAYGWSHPEHTVELTPAEAIELAHLAGFDVEKVYGLWLCRDPLDARLLPLSPASDDKEWTLAERFITAADEPNSAFLWWLEARKSERRPDKAAVETRMSEIFAHAWPERMTRYFTQIGERHERGGVTSFVAGAGASGALVFGPYMPLKAGRYRATFPLITDGDFRDPARVARIDILGHDHREINVRELTRAQIAQGGRQLVLEFQLADQEFAIQARVISHGGARLESGKPEIETLE